MTTVLLATACISGFSAVIYGAAERKRISRTCGVIAAAAFAGYLTVGYVTTGGLA